MHSMRRATAPCIRPIGFTLIELLVAVAIVGILLAIALPSYVDYVQRGKITDATSTLAQQKILMERWYQDHREYGSSECGPSVPASSDFTYTCSWGTSGDNQSFLLTATGKASSGMSGYEFTIDESDSKQTTHFDGDNVTRNCWITRQNESC